MKKQLLAISVLLNVMGQIQGSVELKLPSGSWLKQCHSHHYQYTKNSYQLWAQCYNNKEKTESNFTLVNIDHTKAILTVDVGGQNNNQLLVTYTDGSKGYDDNIEAGKIMFEGMIKQHEELLNKEKDPAQKEKIKGVIDLTKKTSEKFINDSKKRHVIK